MKNILSILLFSFLLVTVYSCEKQHLAKEGDIYIGKVYSNGLYHYDIEGEFTVHILKVPKKPVIYEFYHTDDTTTKYILIEVNYDKNAKELVGTFNETYNYYWYHPEVKGDKKGNDFELDMSDYNSSTIIGSIHLTPKK